MPTVAPLDVLDLSDDELRGRFDWAVRQGYPQWLWPDTTVEAWQDALAQFEIVARQVLTDGHARQPLRGRPEDIGVAGYTSGMGPLLGSWLEQGLIDSSANVGATLQRHLRHNSLRMEAMARRALTVVTALAARGVTAIVFKGMDTAWSIFRDPATRPLSDIDLLIAPADEPIAGEVLCDLGFTPGRIGRYPPACNWRMADVRTTPRTLAFVHSDDPWSIDLQTSLDRRYSYGAPVLALDRLRSDAALEPWSLSTCAWTLSPEARLVHLACHAGCGLGSLTLLRLVELAMAGRAEPGGRPIDWDRFATLAERAGALAMTYPALSLAEQLVPGTIPRNLLGLCEREAPPAVLRVIGRLAPSTAQRVLRCSLEERFMWSPSRLHRLVQTVRELHPPGLPVRGLPALYRMRAWRLLQGAVTR